MMRKQVMSYLNKYSLFLTAMLVPVVGGCVETPVEEALAKAIVAEAATDTYFNIEILRRLDIGDVIGAKNLIQQTICSDLEELEQLKKSNNILSKDKQVAEKAIKAGREFRTKTAADRPLCKLK